MLKISASEKKYIVEGVAADVRADGRDRLSYRNISIETSLLSQSNGSARASIEASGTDVLASVKLEVASPLPEAPNAGIVQVCVSCCPSISAKLYGRAVEELNVELSQLMTRLLCSHSNAELEKYCIIPGESVWSINIDVMVFESTGNVPDIISIAIYAALNDTVFPSVRLVGVESEDKTIEVDMDPAAGKLMMAQHWPICVTLSKIGDYFITDSMQEEELCTTAQMSVAVDPEGSVCGVQKSGTGAIELEEMQQMIDEACARSKELFHLLQNALSEQRNRDIKAGHRVERVGFLG
ncbi:exosome complex exonuclease rrp42-like protein [Plasmopara halstedii]|uniref:Ribosomal RNA-processing protein 42 n=1 Tax=Plasmopara halstedii TaxID=4781 RepID=A0A0P1AL56_PLAHL|nr:exosome complex exonuclease rrp42-like protein [Plasmopara halstedii]CEG41879.1 exosome complex exonuclease rrp42-like protein [Plasmopara halstedii]|eukprot:XP_024578248.1 exosome complex exonuclease rrp42-like protein [Plasmopara halstedii]